MERVELESQTLQQLLAWQSGAAELGLGWEDPGREAASIASDAGRFHPREPTMERWVFVEVAGSLLILAANTLHEFLLTWCVAYKQQASSVACFSSNSSQA